jgi:TP901 family phage tail tape measure protein
MADKSLTLGTLFTANVTEFKRGVDQVIASVGKLERSFNKVHKESSKVSKDMDSASRSTDRYAKATDKAKKSTEDYNKHTKKVVGTLERLKHALKVSLSFGLAAGAIMMFKNALLGGIQAIADYDQALKNLQAITNATDAETRMMGETIKDVARSTKFSTTEVADGMVLLGQAGFSASESVDAMQATANLATGTLSEMSAVTDLVTTTIRAFGLEAQEASRVSDVMANAVNRSKLTIDKLRTVFNYVGATASQAGLSLEETAQVTMNLANAGLRASTIGTGFRQVLSRLISPNRKLRETFQELGISVDKVNITNVGLTQSLEYLTKVLYNTETQSVNMSKAFSLFGLRGAQAAAVLIKSFNSPAWNQSIENVHEIGSAARMAAKQAEGLVVKWKNLSDRIKLIGVAIGESGVSGSMGSFIDILKQLASVLESFLGTELGKFVAIFTTIATVVALVSAAIGGLILLLPSLKAGFAAISIALGKTGLIAASIVASMIGLGVAFQKLTTINERAAKSLEDQSEQTKKTSKSLVFYAKQIDELREKSEKGALSQTALHATIQRMKNALPELADKITDAAGDFEKLSEVINEAFKEENNKYIEQQVQLLDAYSKATEEAQLKTGIMKYSMDTLSNVGTKLSNTFSAVVNEIFEFGQKMVSLGDETKRTNSTFTDYIKNLLSAYSDIDAVADKTADYKKVIQNLAEAMKHLGDDGSVSIQEVRKELDFLVKNGSKSAAEVARMSLDISNAINLMLQNTKNALTEEEQAFVEASEGMTEAFKKIYQEVDGERKVNLVKLVQSYDKERAAFERHAELLSLGEKDLQEGLKAIKEKYRTKAEELKTDLTESEKKKLELTEKVNKKMIDAMKDGVEKMKALYEADVEEFKKSQEFKVMSVEERNAVLLDMEKQHNEEVLKYNQQKEKEIMDAQLERFKLTQQKELYELEQSAQKGNITQERLNKEKLRMEQDLAEEILAIREEELVMSLSMYGIDSAQYLQAANAKIAAEFSLKKAIDARNASSMSSARLGEEYDRINDAYKAYMQAGSIGLLSDRSTRSKIGQSGYKEELTLAEFAKGDQYRGYYSEGAIVPGGYGGGDVIPAMLEPGEVVLRKEVGASLGVDELHSLNKRYGGNVVPFKQSGVQHFSNGGIVSGDANPSIMITLNIQNLTGDIRSAQRMAKQLEPQFAKLIRRRG